MTPHEALKAAVEERMRLAKEATGLGCWHDCETPMHHHHEANDPAFVIRQCARDLELLRRYTEELGESDGRMTRDEIYEHYGRLELLRSLVDDLAEVYQINLGVSDE